VMLTQTLDPPSVVLFAKFSTEVHICHSQRG
jgi:hypothetical protein